MLLHVERARVQIEADTKYVIFLVGEDFGPTNANGVGDKLRDERCDYNRRRTHREEHVQSGSDGSHEHANHPHSNRIGRNIFVILAAQ